VIAAQDAARLNVPDWLLARWIETYGEDTARAIAAAHLSVPPLDIVTKKAPPIEGAEPLFGRSGACKDPVRVDTLPGYAEGDWWVQDAAATLPRSCSAM
jgi:16S rRNA (cytosine967-C5)-methyltransferase